MNLERLDLEKYEQLEMERNSTYADTGFQQWVSELNISQSYEDRGGILRANEDGRYQIWIWDMELNISYPMTISANDISSLSLFTSFVNHTLTLASKGVFDGSPGNMIK